MEMKPGYKQTDSGVIPEEWEIRSIGAICKLINGRGFKPFEWQKDGLPIIRIQNLNGSDEFNFYSGPYDKKLEVQSGQLLFAWSGSRGTSFGPHVWNGTLGLLNYHTWKVQVREAEVAPDFFLHKLRQITAFIEGSAHGASALVHVQKWQMEGFEVALPSTKTEQEVIAEALSDADALIESLEQLRAKKRHIKQGAMQELLTGKRRLRGYETRAGYQLTEIGTIPNDWRVTTVGAEFSIQLGKMLDAEKNSGVLKPYLGNRAVQWGRIDLGDVSEIRLTYSDLLRFRLRRGDLLVCEGGEVGRAAIWNEPLDECYFQKALHRLRPKRGYDQVFFLNVLERLARCGFLDNFVTQTSIAHLPKDKFELVPIPVPGTKAEQMAIAAVLSDMDAGIAALDTKLTKARAVKQGMMQELLTGRIRLV